MAMSSSWFERVVKSRLGSLGFFFFKSESVAVWSRVTAVIVIVVSGTWYVWRRKIEQVKKEETIRVERKSVRQSSKEPILSRQESSITPGDTLYEVDSSARSWADFLQLSSSQVEVQEAKGRAKFVSLHDYMDSIYIPQGVNLRRAFVTGLGRMGMELMLPFVSSMPQLSSKKDVPVDPFFFKIVQSMMKNLVSPVTISAIAMTTHKTAQKLVENRYDPVQDMRNGVDGAKWKRFFDEATMPNPFDLTKQFTPLVEQLLQEVISSPIDFQQTFPVDQQLLPGLHWGSPGIEYRQSPREQAESRVLCAVLNRLNANLLRLAEKNIDPAILEEELFSVTLELQGERLQVYSVDELVQVFMEDPEYQVDVRIRTLLTSFSKSLSVQDVDGQWYHIPLAIPMRTGITAIDGSDIVVPMSHAGIPIRIRGPLFSSKENGVQVECYQNVGSFTGWHPYLWREWAWHLGYERWHDKHFDKHWTPSRQVELVRCASIVSILSNVAANESSLALGGYGFFGVCLDSVAVAQYAVTNQVTIFPLLLSGQARSLMLDVAERMASRLSTDPNDAFVGFSSSITNVRRAIVNLDTDIDLPPKFVVNACERILQTLPDKSMFILVEKSRQQALEVIEYLKKTYYEPSQDRPAKPDIDSERKPRTTKTKAGFSCFYPVENTRQEMLRAFKSRGLVPVVASQPSCLIQWCPFSKVKWNRSASQTLLVSAYFARSGLVDKARLMELLAVANRSDESTQSMYLESVPLDIDGNLVGRLLSIVSPDTVWVLKGAKSNNATSINIVTRDNAEAVCSQVAAHAEKKVERGQKERMVLQRYPEKLLLFSGRKFHIRCNVLCVGRLRVFLHRDCVLHVCSEPYSFGDWENEFKHISNHVLQSNHPKYDAQVNIQTLESLEEQLDKEEGKSTNAATRILANIRTAVVDVFQAVLTHGTNVDFFPLPDSFELFGFDFLVLDDETLTVKLLEVNSGPALEGHSDMQSDVCGRIVQDTVNVILAGWVDQQGSLVSNIQNTQLANTQGTRFEPLLTELGGVFLSDTFRQFVHNLQD